MSSSSSQFPVSLTSAGTGTSAGTRTTARSSSASRTSFPSMPTFPTSTSNETSSFHLPSLAAIIILPILIVLSILSIIYRRWRRAQASRSVVVISQDPPPARDFKPWNESQSHVYNTAPGGPSTFNQQFVGPVNPPQPPSAFSPNHWDTGLPHNMAATYPSTAWGQGGQNDFSEHAHYVPPVQDPSLTRNTSVFSSHPQATGVTYDELVEQSRRWEDTRPDPGMNILSNGSQNYHSSITQVTAGEESVKRREEAAQPQNIASGSRTSPGQPSIVDAQPKESDTTYLPPRTAASQEEHTSTPVPDTAHRKGEVVLNWSHPPEAVSLPQQAGPSGSQAESQPQNAPELLVLRERVQRLEAALVEREQSPGGRGDMPDRPPPAYESL